MNYIKNIFLGAVIDSLLGLFVGTIFGSKVTKKSKWEEKQQIQQILFSVLGGIGGIGGIILGFKIAEEASAEKEEEK
jgi:hypothetical protein